MKIRVQDQSAASVPPAPRRARNALIWRARTAVIGMAVLACSGVIAAPVTVPATALATAPVIVPDTLAQRVAACTACHGAEGRTAGAEFFPRIAGKPAGYLYNQLTNFREGRRQYPLMTYLVGHMPDAYLQEIASHFSQLHLPYAAIPVAKVAPAVLERGRVLVMTGEPAKKIPACIACHGEKLTGALPAIPSLVGLPVDYLNSQFGAWKNGTRQALAPDCMAHISQQLAADDIGAVSAWLAAQPVPRDMTPLSRTTVKLPLPCGSAPAK